MKTSVIVIECKVEEIRLQIGKGNQLLLFKGDRILICAEPNPKHRYRVLDSHENVIGSLTKREIYHITDRPLKKGVEHALVP